MPKQPKDLIVSTLTSNLVKGVAGGFVATSAFRLITSVKDPFVLGVVFAIGASASVGAQHDDKQDPEVS